MTEFEVFELSNGIRVVHKQVDRPIAHCGLMIKAGARDESLAEEGLAHFIEHVFFKGTEKRKAYHILSRMEDVGGEINAYTTKEDTVIYSSFLKEDYGRAVELLFDIAFHSTFPEKELNKEKEVIIDEINSYKDSPSELIFDDFEMQMFPEHPLGMNILGSPKTVKSFTKDQVQHFLKRFYSTSNLVFSSVGNISSEKLRIQLEKHTEDVVNSKAEQQSRLAPSPITATKKLLKRPVFQCHAIVGNRAYEAGHAHSRTLHLVNNLLGGPGMNSRLNLNIREKYGFTYNIESFYSPYSDTGLFGVYAGTDASNLEKTLNLVKKELQKLREQPLGVNQLKKAKRQMLGQIAMAQENNVSLMLGLGKSLLTFNRIDSFKEITEKIENISSSDILSVSNEIFEPQELSTLIYQPE